MKTLLPLVQFLVQNCKKQDLETAKRLLSKDELDLFVGISQFNFKTDIIAAQEVFGIKSNTPKYPTCESPPARRHPCTPA